MNSKDFKLLTISIILVFLLSYVSGVNAIGKTTQSNGKVDISTNQATITVTGGANVPSYHIQLNGSSNASGFLIKFANLQEFNDKNNDGFFQNNEKVGSAINFPSTNWDFSGFRQTNDSNDNPQKIDFNFTNSGTPMIQLRNHVDFTNGHEIKFDIIISNFFFSSNSDKLALKMTVTGGNLKNQTNSQDVSFGDAYLKSTTTASTPDGDINVKTQVDGGSSLYIIYDAFNGTMTHDPTFGAVAGSGGSNVTGASLELVPIMVGFLVIGLVYNKKRRYD